jgi:outer membrane protein assembly factor BamB
MYNNKPYIVAIFSLSVLLSLIRPSIGVAESAYQLSGARIAVELNSQGEAHYIYVVSDHSIECLEEPSHRLVWKAYVPRGISDSGPVIAGKTLAYISNDISTVVALDADTGILRWSKGLQAAHITSSNTTIYLTISNGMGVQALDAVTGNRIWKYEPGGPGSIFILYYVNNVIYTDEYSLNAKNGKVINKYSPSIEDIFSTAQLRFQAESSGKLEAFKDNTNLPLWAVSFSDSLRTIALAATQEYVSIVRYDGMAFVAHAGILSEFRTTDGHVVWQIPLSASVGLQAAPVASDGNAVYLLMPENASTTQLRAIDISSGEILWAQNFEGALDGPPVIAGAIIYITAGPKLLYEIDKASGQLLHEVSVQNSAAPPR